MTAPWTPKELLDTLSEFRWEDMPFQATPAWQNYLATYQLPSPSEDVQHRAGLLSIGGFNLVVQTWQPAQVTGTALIVHGLYDHVGLYRHLIRYCLQRQWRVIAFDWPGHGLSSGKRASIDSFQQYDQIFTCIVKNISDYSARPWHFFGQSMGGAVLINYLLKYNIKPDALPLASVNLIAPLVRPKEWKKIKYLYWLVKMFKTTIHRGRSINSQDQNFLDFLWHQDPLQAGELGVNWLGAAKAWGEYIEHCPASKMPINIVQGNDDNTVLWRYDLAFLRRKFPLQKLLILNTGRHHLVNEIEPLRDQMWEFFDENI